MTAPKGSFSYFAQQDKTGTTHRSSIRECRGRLMHIVPCAVVSTNGNVGTPLRSVRFSSVHIPEYPTGIHIRWSYHWTPEVSVFVGACKQTPGDSKDILLRMRTLSVTACAVPALPKGEHVTLSLWERCQPERADGEGKILN